MSKKKQHHEEHADESWLLPYADLLTLLLALFIVMFAMSKVDKEKLEKLSEEFRIIFSSGAGIFEKEGKKIIKLEGSSKESSKETEEKKQETAKKTEEKEMNTVKNEIKKVLEGSGQKDQINVILMNEYLEITIQDIVLFELGGAEVLTGVYPLLKNIANSIKGLDNNIRIVGHTDNLPISSSQFRSNWDLSAIRAINVMNFMVKEANLDPKRISIQAYGEYMPKFSNSTAEGRKKNRRVEILIYRKYNADDKVKPDVTK